MLRTEDLEALKRRVAGYPAPILSAYLNVNPANPENRGKAYATRLKDALKENGVRKAPGRACAGLRGRRTAQDAHAGALRHPHGSITKS
jgi:hypothetical protein